MKSQDITTIKVIVVKGTNVCFLSGSKWWTNCPIVILATISQFTLSGLVQSYSNRSSTYSDQVYSLPTLFPFTVCVALIYPFTSLSFFFDFIPCPWGLQHNQSTVGATIKIHMHRIPSELIMINGLPFTCIMHNLYPAVSLAVSSLKKSREFKRED